MLRASTISLFIAVALSACASGGGPGLVGNEAEAFYQRWNGSWTLDEEVSDDPSEVLAELRGGPTRSGEGAGGGSAGRGGRSGGGRSGGGRGGQGGRGGGAAGGVGERTPPPIAQIRAILGTRPATITLELGDSLFTMIEARRRAQTLPMNGDSVEPDGPNRPEAKVTWSGTKPTVEREWEGWRVRDELELLTDDRLLMTRKINAGNRRVEIRLVFDRDVSDTD